MRDFPVDKKEHLYESQPFFAVLSVDCGARRLLVELAVGADAVWLFVDPAFEKVGKPLYSIGD